MTKFSNLMQKRVNGDIKNSVYCSFRCKKKTNKKTNIRYVQRAARKHNDQDPVDEFKGHSYEF